MALQANLLSHCFSKLYDFEKQWLSSFACKAIVIHFDMKIKYEIMQYLSAHFHHQYFFYSCFKSLDHPF